MAISGVESPQESIPEIVIPDVGIVHAFRHHQLKADVREVQAESRMRCQLQLQLRRYPGPTLPPLQRQECNLGSSLAPELCRSTLPPPRIKQVPFPLLMYNLMVCNRLLRSRCCCDGVE